MQRYEGVREYFFRAREVLVVEVVRFSLVKGEQDEMPLEVGTQI